MKFEYLHTEGNKRYYKADKEIKKFPNTSFDWDTEIKDTKKRLIEGVELLDEKCFCVCVSDAHTHIERLVFAAGKVKMPDGEINYSPYSMHHIDGNFTFMIHGGDEESIKDDQVYLRHISILNK